MSFQNYDEQAKLHEARALIKQKQYGQAMRILEELDTPSARKLHEKMARRLMPDDINMEDQQSSNQTRFNLKFLFNGYWQVRILSYGVRFIALVWFILGVRIVYGEANPILGFGVNIVSRVDAGILTMGQAFFIYVAGATLDLLADMASNIKLNNQLLKSGKNGE